MDAPLYNARILRLAAAIPLADRLERPQATVEKVSPICGSRVTVDLDLDTSGRVARFGQAVRACALGQASAAILGAGVLGASAAELRAAHRALGDYLRHAADLPVSVAARFPELEVFAPARPHRARHASILLAFDAAASAAEAAGRQAA
ncbi:iron-sulfur cluster assembly scaffold protein [Thermaurantiacus sp.]